MSNPAPVLYELVDNVATLRLNRPDRLNALTPALLAQLREGLNRAVTEGARAVLVTGEGRAFSAGADLAAGDALERDLSVSLTTNYNPVAETYAALPIPVVTAMNGPAAGAGASIALMGDIVVAARSSYLLLAFANIGLVPDAGATWLVAKAAGRARVLEMALLGEKLPAEQALEAGLVTRVVDDADLMPTAQALAAKLAAMPTKALGMIRKQVAAALSSDLTATLAIEAAHQRDAGYSADFAEGVRAFNEKRPAVFQGK